MQWKVAIKKASAEVKRGKTKPLRAVKRKRKRIAGPTRSRSNKPKKVVTTHTRQTTIGRMSRSSLTTAKKMQRKARELFLKVAAELYAKKMIATKVKQKKKLQKQITDARRQVFKSTY
jgi:hypothetical protein